MLADREALLAGVLARPADDLPRLVFADYLEESGHPALVARAAFIRAQIDAANAADDAAAVAFTRHAAALRSQFTDEADAILDAGRRDGLRALRRRGFVSDLRGSARVLRDSVADVFRVAPVTALQIESLDGVAGWVRGAAFLRPLTHVTVGPGALTGLAAEPRAFPLLDSPHLGSVERLSLARNGIADGWLVWFVSGLRTAAIARSLAALDLSHNALTDRAASFLAAARGLDGLTRVDLRGNRISPGAAGALAQRFGSGVLV